MRDIVISIPCDPSQEDDSFVGPVGQQRLVQILQEAAEMVGETDWPSPVPGNTVVLRSAPDSHGVRRKILDIRLY
jgi:hypothetical protein